jgi:hypothetical protein
MRVLPLLLAALSLPAATYYVDATNGNDSWSGLAGSFVSGTTGPWKTLAKVQGSSFAAGDQILLKRGERWRESLNFPSSGSAGNPIVIGDYGTGALPIIDGSEIVTGWTLHSGSVYYKAGWGFNSLAVFENDKHLMRGASSSLSAGHYWYDSAMNRLYIRLTDSAHPATKTIQVTRYPDFPFALMRFNTKAYVIVQNLDFHKSNYFGMMVENGSAHVTVRWCTFDRIYQNVLQAEGALTEANSSNVDFLYNTITHSGLARGYMNTGEAEAVGINLQGVQTGSAIGNVIIDQGGEGIQVLAGASNVTINNNRIVNSHRTGLYVGAGWGNGGHVTNITAAYNYSEPGPLSGSQAMSIATEYALSPFTFNATTDVITATWNISWLNNYPIRFVAGTSLPTGLNAGTVYYTRNLSGTSFEVWTAPSPGGSKVDLSGTNTGSYVQISHRIDGVSFHHNVVRGNDDALGCFLFGNGQNPGGNIRNVRFHHNVCTNSSYGVIAMGPTDDTSNVFSNNIYSVKAYGRAYWIGQNAGVPNSITNYQMVDHDVVHGPTAASFIVELGGSTIPFTTGTLYSLSGWRTAAGHGRHSIDSDPLLKNLSSGEVTLQPQSPAIDAGIAVKGVSQVRYGSAPDIGSHEHSGGKLNGSDVTKLRNRHKASMYP